MCDRLDSQEVGLEAAILERVRNSSLVESDRARIIYRGSSLEPKLRIIRMDGGRGALPVQRSRAVRHGGALGSENTGMSSVRDVSKRPHRMAEVSAARFILGGLVGPKPRPKGVGDGNRVNSPEPQMARYHPQGGRRSVGLARRWLSGCNVVGGPGG